MTHRTFTKAELDTILAQHKEWLVDNTRGSRADLSFANLSSADLRSADLSFANLSSADLRFADLSSADLRCANLSSADLRCANLSSADLRFADLSSADLRCANLLIFQYQRQTAYFTMDGTLRIGCIVLPITEWAETYQDIGKNNEYTDIEIMAYGSFIQLCLKLFKEQK